MNTQQITDPFQNSAIRKRGNPCGFAVLSPSRNIESACWIENGSSVQTPLDRPYHLASVGKMFTSVIIRQLCEKKTIEPSAPLSAFFPQEFFGAKWKVLHDTTVSQLLSHTSRIPDYYLDKNKERKNLFNSMIQAPEKFWSPDETIAWARDELQVRQANKPHYSDTNYQILGKIAETLHQQKLHQIFEEYIFKPCDMKSTFMPFYSLPASGEAEFADLYYRKKNLSTSRSISMSWGGGGVVSTMGDQLKFFQCLNAGKLISAPTLAQMKSFQPLSFGIQYGEGIMKFSNFLMPRRFEIWGHSGSVGSFLYYNEHHDTYFVGTYNSVNQVVLPIVTIMKAIGKIS